MYKTNNEEILSCIVYKIFLYFSQDVNFTISIIKSKQNCRFTHECICTEVALLWEHSHSKCKNQIWTQGFLHLLHYISLDRGSARTLASEKQVGLSKMLCTPGSEKKIYAMVSHFLYQTGLVTLRWTQCFGWNRKKLRKKDKKTKQIGEGEKSDHTNVLDNTFVTLGIQNRHSDALVKRMYYLFVARKQTAKAAELH